MCRELVAAAQPLPPIRASRRSWPSELKKATPLEWSKDAFELAVTVGYRSGNLKGRFLAFGKDTPTRSKAKAPELPADYPRPGAGDRETAVRLAGHRLAELLHQVAKAEDDAVSMDKAEVAAVLEEIATLLELKGDNAFKTNAYNRGARAIAQLEGSLADYVTNKKLGTIPGIGEAARTEDP